LWTPRTQDDFIVMILSCNIMYNYIIVMRNILPYIA